MKKIITCLLTILGLTSACGQKSYEDADVKCFSVLIAKPDVVVLDVRTAEEFDKGHIENALNIDVRQSDFLEKARTALPKDKTIAVYCRSGKRSANASEQLLMVTRWLISWAELLLGRIAICPLRQTHTRSMYSRPRVARRLSSTLSCTPVSGWSMTGKR